MPSFGGGGALSEFTLCPAQLRRDMVVGARQGNEGDGQDRDCVAAVRNQRVALLGAAGFAVRAGFRCMD